jgi:hypothetical protein
MPPTNAAAAAAAGGFGGGGGNSGAMIASLCDAAAQKQPAVRSEISENHGHSAALAGHLAVGGSVERLLRSMCGGDGGGDGGILNERDVSDFFEVQRRRLHLVAQRNADNERNLQGFVAACQQIKQDALNRLRTNRHGSSSPPTSSAEGSGGGAGSPEDYVRAIREIMYAQSENLANHESVQKFVREIKVQLRQEKEKLPGGIGDDDDIELVVDGPGAGTGATQGAALKCPLTCTFARRSKNENIYPKAAARGAGSSCLSESRCGLRTTHVCCFDLFGLIL